MLACLALKKQPKKGLKQTDEGIWLLSVRCCKGFVGGFSRRQDPHALNHALGVDQIPNGLGFREGCDVREQVLSVSNSSARRNGHGSAVDNHFLHAVHAHGGDKGLRRDLPKPRGFHGRRGHSGLSHSKRR